MHRSRSHHAVIRVYDEADNVIETHDIVAIAASIKIIVFICIDEKTAGRCAPVRGKIYISIALSLRIPLPLNLPLFRLSPAPLRLRFSGRRRFVLDG